MNRSNRRFDPLDEFAGEGSDARSREAIERARKVRHAIEAGLRFHRQGDLRQAADIYARRPTSTITSSKCIPIRPMRCISWA